MAACDFLFFPKQGTVSLVWAGYTNLYVIKDQDLNPT